MFNDRDLDAVLADYGPPGPELDAVSPFADRPGRTRIINGGTQWRFDFPNGYGASVVRHSFSYGREQGLWELGVIGTNGRLTYHTPITDDVIGHLDEAAVTELLGLIEELPTP